MLDINTPKGQNSLNEEQEMLKYMTYKWRKTGKTFIQTIKDKAAYCDGFIVKDNEIIGLFESKCRKLSFSELEKFGTWLITYEKLEQCKQLSYALKVPFYGFLYLIKDKKVGVWKIAEDGEYSFEFKIEETITQKNINGGEIKRKNAYLPVKNSKFI